VPFKLQVTNATERQPFIEQQYLAKRCQPTHTTIYLD